MKQSKLVLISTFIYLVALNQVFGKKSEQFLTDYTIQIVSGDDDVSFLVYLRCKKSLSCSFRFQDQNNHQFQLESLQTNPMLIKIHENQISDRVNSILKQDEYNNYALFIINKKYTIHERDQKITIEISTIKKKEESILESFHFLNLYNIHRIEILQTKHDISEYQIFSKLQNQSFISSQSPIDISQNNQRQRKLVTDQTYLVTLVKTAHAIGLLIIWGFVVDFSIICVRYFKAYKKYLRFHASVFAISNICSLIVIFFQISQRTNQIENLDQQPEKEKERAHFGIGLTMMFIIILQHLIGMVTKLNFENENGSEKVHYIKLVHKILGYTIYLLGKINVIIGADLFEKRYYVKDQRDNYWCLSMYLKINRAKAIGGVYVIQAIIIGSIEFLYKQEPEFLIKKKVNTKEYEDLDKQAQHNAIIDRLSNNVPIQQINRQFPDILYVVHENSVYDITEIQHPGGQFILKHIKGKEISRYFNGGYACEQTKMAPYRHTLYAQNFLKQFFIGDIKHDYYNILIPNENIEQQKSYIPKNVWSLEEVRQVNDYYKVFLFTNQNFRVKTYLPGVRWFGRNVVVTPQIDTLNIHSRNYTVVLSYMEENYRYRLELIKYFQNKIRDDLGMSQMSQVRTFNPPDHVLITNKVPLLIKKEIRNAKNGLSKFLHLEVHKLYYISEPIGHGLEIDENSDGDHIIFAAGTGILPFIDLFDYLLKKFGQREANLVNPHNERYEQTFGPDFRIKLYAAFTSKAECYGYQIISDLHTFCSEFQIPWFSAIIRFANSESDHFLPSTKSYFDSQFIDLALSQTFPTKFLICGPPEFNKNIYNILTTVRGIDEQRVQIV